MVSGSDTFKTCTDRSAFWSLSTDDFLSLMEAIALLRIPNSENFLRLKEWSVTVLEDDSFVGRFSMAQLCQLWNVLALANQIHPDPKLLQRFQEDSNMKGFKLDKFFRNPSADLKNQDYVDLVYGFRRQDPRLRRSSWSFVFESAVGKSKICHLERNFVEPKRLKKYGLSQIASLALSFSIGQCRHEYVVRSSSF